MRRSLAIFAVGLLLGGLIGYAWRSAGGIGGREEASRRSDHAARTASAKNATRPVQGEADRILLGNITSVPFQELYEVMSRQTPEELAALARQFDDLAPGPQTTAKIGAFFKAWAHLDPTSAFEKATALPSKEGRSAAIGATIAGADPTAMDLLAPAIGKLSNDVVPGSARNGLFDQAIEKWSEIDPAAAGQALAESKIEGMRFTSAYYTVAQNWAATDPEAALAWAQQQHAVPFGMNAVTGAVIGWWKKDAPVAEAYALAQIGTPSGKQLISSLVSRMGGEDRAKATAWVQSLPDADLRSQSYGMLASQFAFADPKEASAWALTLPPDAVPGAVESTVSMWARADPAAAAHFIEGLSGKIRDGAVSSYSWSVAETDPAAAAAWAITISDEEKRLGALRWTTSKWLETDPVAARAWVQSSSLGEEEKTRLLAKPKPKPSP